MKPLLAAGTALLGGLIGLVSAWLTWTVSGAAERNSYASLRAAQRIGLEELTPYRIGWYLVPVAVLASAVLLAGGARRIAGVVSVIVGLVLVGFGVWVLLQPVAGVAGPWSACLGGSLALTGGIGLVAQGNGPS